MKQEAEKRAELERKGHGSYEEVSEGDFLEVRVWGGRWSGAWVEWSGAGVAAVVEQRF